MFEILGQQKNEEQTNESGLPYNVCIFRFRNASDSHVLHNRPVVQWFERLRPDRYGRRFGTNSSSSTAEFHVVHIL